MNREELIAKIQELLPFIGTWENYEKKRNEMQIKISSAANEVSKLKERNVVVFLLVGAGYGFILSLFAMVPIAKMGLFSPYIWFGFIGLVAFIYMKIASKNNKEKIAAKEATIEKLKEQYRILNEEYSRAKKPWDNKIYAIFPQKYAYPSTIKTLYSYLVNRRADSLKEAINLFENEQQQQQLKRTFDAYDNKIAAMQREQKNLEQRVADAEFEANQAYIRSLNK